MKTIVLISALLLIATTSYPQPSVTFQTLSEDLTQPLDIAAANDGTGRLFIVEKAGLIKIWNGTSLLPEPFIDLTDTVKATGGEQGLLSLAFHPDYETNGYFYVYYTNKDDDVTLARYTRSSLNTANQNSGVVLMTIYKPYLNHNGAKLLFGTDGYLYFGTGDGGSGGDPGDRAQNGDSLLGKMLRINVNNPNPPYYSIPADNPYVNNPAVRDEIIALGLRNPWRWSFDRQTGDMWLPDVGQDLWEEVNVRAAGTFLGVNYGWDCFEATHVFNSNCTAEPNKVTPIFEYPHNINTGGFSITGGYVYRGTDFPGLQGYYLVSDYISNHGWLIKPDGNQGWTVTMQATWANRISTYGEGEDGELYAASLADGILYKVLAGDPLPVRVVSFTGRQNGNLHELSWQVQNEQKGDVYIVEKRVDPAQPFTEISRRMSAADNSANKYSVNAPANELAYYRLQVKGRNNTIHYSSIVTLKTATKRSVKAVVSGNTLQVSLPLKATSVKIFDAGGRLVMQKKLTGNQTENIPLQNISKGILTVSVHFHDGVETIRVVH